MAERGCLKPWEKEIATAEPVGMSCCYNIAAEVVKIQMKHLRSSFTTLLAHELSMGEKGQNRNGLTGQTTVSSLHTAHDFFFWYDYVLGLYANLQDPVARYRVLVMVGRAATADADDCAFQSAHYLGQCHGEVTTD